MTKSKLIRIMMIVLSATILLGSLLALYLVKRVENGNVINVDLKDGVEVLEFSDLGLIPGESAEFKLSIKVEKKQRYDIKFDFSEKEDIQTLKKYARAKIEADGEVLIDCLLEELFMEDHVLSIDFGESKTQEITITYYMPKETGNEAQAAEAKFELIISASNE